MFWLEIEAAVVFYQRDLILHIQLEHNHTFVLEILHLLKFTVNLKESLGLE